MLMGARHQVLVETGYQVLVRARHQVLVETRQEDQTQAQPATGTCGAFRCLMRRPTQTQAQPHSGVSPSMRQPSRPRRQEQRWWRGERQGQATAPHQAHLSKPAPFTG